MFPYRPPCRRLLRAAQAFALLLTLMIATLAPAPSSAQDLPAYRIFTGDGKPARIDDIVDASRNAEVVFFGEQHDDAMSHWLELQVFKRLHQQRPQWTLAMEMFETDDQLVLDEYLNGTIEESHLLKEAKVWPNYKADYKPLVEFARSQKLAVVASNIPRRYASLVHRKGLAALDALPAQARQWIAPLPITVDLDLPGYRHIATTMGHRSTVGKADDMARAQAVKDATMAHSILQVNGPVFHVNGAYHSKNGEGIIWYLKRVRPDIRIVTLHAVPQASLDALEAEHRGAADFVIAVPRDMAKTY